MNYSYVPTRAHPEFGTGCSNLLLTRVKHQQQQQLGSSRSFCLIISMPKLAGVSAYVAITVGNYCVRREPKGATVTLSVLVCFSRTCACSVMQCRIQFIHALLPASISSTLVLSRYWWNLLLSDDILSSDL